MSHKHLSFNSTAREKVLRGVSHLADAVGVSGLVEARRAQQSLFADEDREKQTQLDQTADRIRERFGSSALHRASGMLHSADHKPMPRPPKRTLGEGP